MNNFQHATEATNTALESQGSANRENSRYMESLTAHITALKAAFQDLSRTVLESGFLESLLDVLTKIVKTLADNPWMVQIGLMTAGVTSIAALTKNFLPILAAFTSGLGGLSAAAGTAGAAGALSTFATVLGSIAPYALAASAAIVGLIAIYKAWKDAHPDLDTMNEQLQTNKDRLEALNKIPYASRTTEINDEIAALEKENAQLEENIEKKQQAQAIKKGKEIETTYAGDPSTKYSVEVKGVEYTASSLENLIQKLKDAQVISEDYIGTLSEFDVQSRSTADNISDMIDVVQGYNEKVKSGIPLTADQVEQYQEYSSTLQSFATDVNDAAAAGSNMSDEYLRLATIADSTAQKAQELSDQFIQQNTSLTALAGGVNLTQQEYDALIKKFPELEEYLSVVSGSVEQQNALWGLNVDALASAAAQGNQWAISMIKNTMKVGEAIDIINRGLAQAEGTYRDINTGKTSGYSPYASQLKSQETDTKSKLESLLASAEKGEKVLAGKKSPTSLVSSSGGGSSASTSKAQKEQESSDDEHLEALKSIVSLRKSESDLLESSNAETDKQIDKYHEIQTALHNQAEYMRGVLATMKKQGKSQKEINEYQESINSLSKDWWSYQSKITSLIEKQAEAKKKAAKEALEEREEAAEEEQDELEKIAEYAQAVADAQIEKIDEQIDALDEVNDELDDQIEKQQLLEALATAKSQQLYVYKDGKFQYVEDTESISKAQQDLADFEREQRQKKEKEALEAEKQRWEDYKDGWGDLTKTYTTEQGKLLYEQKYGTDIENQNWTTRLKNLADFVSEYNSLLSQINSMQTQLDTEQYGDVYLDQATQDYINEQKRLYNEAKARGDWEGMEEANKNANEARGLGRVTTATGDIAGVRGSSTSSSSRSSTSSGGSSGSSSRTYNVGSARGQSFLNEAPAGSTMTGSDGSKWTKNSDGSTTISKGSDSYHVSAGSSTGTIKKKAHGTYSAEGGLTLVGENGPELRVLNQGDGILPTNLTRSLFKIASNPSLATMRNGGNISTHINISNVTLPNVKDAESLVDGLKNLAYQRAYART